MLGAPSARKPDAALDHGRHQSRKDPVLARPENVGRPDDDDLEVIRRRKQPFLFEELHLLVRVCRLELRLFGDPCEVAGSVYVCGRDVDDAPDASSPRSLDHALQQVRRLLPIANAVPGHDRLGAEDDHLHAGDRVVQGLVVGVAVELDDRDVLG